MKLTSLVPASGSTAKQMLRESVFERTEASPAMASETLPPNPGAHNGLGSLLADQVGQCDSLSESNSLLGRFPLPLSLAHGILPLLLPFFSYFRMWECSRTSVHTQMETGGCYRKPSSIALTPCLLRQNLSTKPTAHYDSYCSPPCPGYPLSRPSRMVTMNEANISTQHYVVSGIWTLVLMLTWWIISLDHFSSFIKYMWSWKSLKYSPNQFFTLKHITFPRPLLESK